MTPCGERRALVHRAAANPNGSLAFRARTLFPAYPAQGGWRSGTGETQGGGRAYRRRRRTWQPGATLSGGSRGGPPRHRR